MNKTTTADEQKYLTRNCTWHTFSGIVQALLYYLNRTVSLHAK